MFYTPMLQSTFQTYVLFYILSVHLMEFKVTYSNKIINKLLITHVIVLTYINVPLENTMSQLK
jgi:hypothetical protein